MIFRREDGEQYEIKVQQETTGGAVLTVVREPDSNPEQVASIWLLSEHDLKQLASEILEVADQIAMPKR